MDQLELFAPGRSRGAAADRLEAEHEHARIIARRLPANLFFGTSSWGFPGWEGIVYSRRMTAAVLAREGLLEYACHPLLRTVGIDRSFYAPVPPADLARYASQLPEGFPCCAKAPEAVTALVRAGERSLNPDFLRSERFIADLLEPFHVHFADHTGPFILQFPPAPPAARLTPPGFARRLERFLSALPSSARYAAELRDAALLTQEYREVLTTFGVAHVYNYATAMPFPEEQAAAVPLDTAAFVMIRLLLRPGTRCDDRRDEFLPFDRILDPAPRMRREVVDLARRALSLGRRVYVLVNNKAEGCSPLTIRALAEMLASGGRLSE